MQVRPNKTVVRGKVRSIRIEPGGLGTEVNLEVLGNESPSHEDDFIRPEEGSMLRLFSSNPSHELRVGDEVRVEARLNAGPTGSRAVLQKLEPVKTLAGARSRPPGS
jgi:hypothetical protein